MHSKVSSYSLGGGGAKVHPGRGAASRPAGERLLQNVNKKCYLL